MNVRHTESCSGGKIVTHLREAIMLVWSEGQERRRWHMMELPLLRLLRLQERRRWHMMQWPLLPHTYVSCCGYVSCCTCCSCLRRVTKSSQQVLSSRQACGAIRGGGRRQGIRWDRGMPSTEPFPCHDLHDKSTAIICPHTYNCVCVCTNCAQIVCVGEREREKRRERERRERERDLT